MLIQTYKKTWTDDFQKIRKVLDEALIYLHISIEHIGSTAIPDLAAKPIIDIDIIFAGKAVFDRIKTELETLGYYHAGDQGIPEREVFKRNKNGGKHVVLDAIVHHLYVCDSHCEELKRHILFRDTLIADSDARIQYQDLKYEIAAEANDDKTKYAVSKELKATEFINNIIAKALNTK